MTHLATVNLKKRRLVAEMASPASHVMEKANTVLPTMELFRDVMIRHVNFLEILNHGKKRERLVQKKQQ
jgi:hypothetical protein